LNIFLFDSELNWRYANLTLIVDFLLLFLSEFYFILCMFCIFICINFVYFLCHELWLFYVHFFSLSFFLVKYLILLMFCFIMYWPTDNSDILRLYTLHIVIVVQCQLSNFSAISCWDQVNFQWYDEEVRFILEQHA
jgi:hypothetical protein